ncbi:MAG: hypothetical protein RL160_393 [Bacteroidota bacterium]
MTNPVDHSEWIDRYLRGELRGEELELFERRLRQDAAFALEFNTQKLLAEGIRQARRDELKRYIAERTRQRVITLPRNRSFLIGIAASIALFAAGWLGWKSVLPKVETSVVASNNPSPGTNAPESGIPALPPPSNAQKDHTQNRAQEELVAVVTPDVAQELVEDAPTNFQDDAGIPESDMPLSAPAEPAPELVASVRLALAEWEQNETMAGNTPDQITTTKAMKKVPEKAPTTSDESPASAPQTIRKDNSIQAQYDLVFLNVPEPGISYEIKSGNQIIINNLDYLNPLLIRYRSRYFLKSAGQWYELNIQAKGRQPLVALKDKALLNEFGSE